MGKISIRSKIKRTRLTARGSHAAEHPAPVTPDLNPPLPTLSPAENPVRTPSKSVEKPETAMSATPNAETQLLLAATAITAANQTSEPSPAVGVANSVLESAPSATEGKAALQATSRDETDTPGNVIDMDDEAIDESDESDDDSDDSRTQAEKGLARATSTEEAQALDSPPDHAAEHVRVCTSMLTQIQDAIVAHPAAATKGTRNPWLKTAATLLQRTLPRTVIGVLGNTGVGKSSLLNALLHEASILPTSGSRGEFSDCAQVFEYMICGFESFTNLIELYLILVPRYVLRSRCPLKMTFPTCFHNAGCTAAVVELQFNSALAPDADATTAVPVYSAVIEFIRKQDWIDGK